MAGDVSFDKVVLLLPFDGPNAGTVAEDRSTFQQAATFTGTAALSTTASKFGGTSLRCLGTTGRVSVTHNTNQNFGSGDFTVELWVNVVAVPAATKYPSLIAKRNSSTSNNSWGINMAPTGQVYWELSTSGTGGLGAASLDLGTPATGVWVHYAVCRVGDTISSYQNGVLKGAYVIGATALANSTAALTVGCDASANLGYPNVYIDDVRITIGESRYTAAFTPPAVAHPIGYPDRHDEHYFRTPVILHGEGSQGSTTITDSSMANRTMTANGSAAIARERSKLGGGSIYIPGASSYVSTPSTSDLVFGTGDFAIESWVYFTAATLANVIAAKGTGTAGWEFHIAATSRLLTFTENTSTVVAQSVSGVALNTWTHVAVARESGTLYIIVNGAVVASAASTTNYTETDELRIGRGRATSTNYFTGYIDALRITNESRGYAAGITNYGDALEYGQEVVQGSVTFTGLVPTGTFPLLVTPSIGTIALTGSAPSVTTPIKLYPTVGQINVQGGIARVPAPYVGTALVRTVSISGNVPTLATTIFPQEYFSVGGGSFTTTPVIKMVPIYDTVVTGRGFGTAPGIFGGAEVLGQGFGSEATITIDADESIYVTGQGFVTTLGFSFTPASNGKVTGRGFGTAPSILGGAVVTGRGFGTNFTSTLVAPTTITITGRGFGTNFTSTLVAPTTITVTGRGFGTVLGAFGSNKVLGRGFGTKPTIVFEGFAIPSEAYVMNINTAQVTRYTNYPFMHLVTIGGRYYGVKKDGFYLLDGDLDIEDPVNGTITTKDTDFNMYQSKNVPFAYLNGDDDYLTTPIVDDVPQPTDSSDFYGRKVKMARGSKGRYWAFKIENIKKLQGVEFLVDQLSRRVK